MRLEKAKYKSTYIHDYPIISYTYSKPYDIYFSVSDYYDNVSEDKKHYIAAEAQGWCELAIAGDKYEQYVVRTHKNYLRGTYEISDELTEKMANTKDSLIVEYFIKETGKRTVDLRSYDISEVKLLSKLRYDDFDDVKTKKLVHNIILKKGRRKFTKFSSAFLV